MALSTPPRGVRPGDFLLVVHDFDARGTDELTLRRGEKIELIELDEGFGDGWYLGKDVRTGTTGLFPGVYTTAAPKIPIRPPREDMIVSDDPKPAAEDQLSSELVASPKSGESTPQASRHASISETQPPEVATDLSSMKSSPNQQHRSSSSPLPTSRLAVDIQQSIRQTLDGQLKGQDSPVMNETLSVIDEHITDLSTPRHSVANHENKASNDSSSEYSSHLEHRVSYIRGHETDEEEENQPTEEQVRSWDAAETARHLRELGVEAKHCDIFEDQEITGDVLLDMDQEFLFMKEFDFGVMGRRLKTWHKVKAFQEEVKGLKQQQQQRGSASSYPAPPEDRSLSRASHTGPFLPRIPHLTRGSAGSIQHPRLTPVFMDHQRRPSAASIREINHHRRHSSIDTGHRVDTSPHTGHFKQSSFDRNWTLASGSQRVPSRSGTYPIYPEGVLPQHTLRRPDTNESDSAVSVTDRYDELERGYFSGPEGDTTKNRRLLQKRSSVTGSATHSRQPSYADDKLKVNKRHSRISSVDSIRDTAKQAPAAVVDVQSTAAPKSRFRSLSTRVIDRRGPTSQSSTPTSTEKPSSGFFSSFAPLAPFVGKSDAEGSGRASSLSISQSKSAGPKTRRTGGLRIISDVVGKGIDTSVAPASPVRDTDPASVRTGSTTPSTSKSSERHSTESSIKNAEGGISLPRPNASVKAGPKSKKDTSAYMRGLEKKTPQEQMDGCDYSGWMKKRSSNLMTTWKPRLFVLRGRRLSYYYSENDTEERGLIDITAHRVLRADNDPIVALHATITGATASPTSPSPSNGADTSPADKSSTSPSARNSKLDPEGPFFFKLVPPKTSRTVQFTKPAVHYFQVDSVREGRLWMAALMKATIERDMSRPVETTNKQKTVSLKQARMMNQRPPALMTESELQETKEEEKRNRASTETEERNNGLRIHGLNVDKAPVTGESKEDEPASPDSLDGLDTGPSCLLPETLLKSD
ncbi:hypothetical protein KXW39_004327 [Aspergillus fumigatus]|nr:hypothetical protein CNMCM8714_004142 [Aspergillus fumigatus]KAH1303519.1 hypothetical protein KXX11_001968 [Aspergillus fumigatus]KAH1527634.1 hypothetical protein KXX18_001140 [Aspergillus fumigatus]KAH2049514.1 hypothetical protein KXV43_004547 [Aspergillus fumigatus]KAH2080058.1 hypothetical protein KXW32_006981 [Aspergillus fumigatus]